MFYEDFFFVKTASFLSFSVSSVIFIIAFHDIFLATFLPKFYNFSFKVTFANLFSSLLCFVIYFHVDKLNWSKTNPDISTDSTGAG